MDETFARLEAEYCPPIDPALLSAIVSDFDLSLESNVQQARAILDSLKESALVEEAAGFDAFGTGARDEGLIHATRPESCPGARTSLSRETDLTSLTNDVSSIDIHSQDGDSSTPINGDIAEDLENADEETKIVRLEAVLQDRVSRQKIQYTLRKCNGRWHAAFDELLNHVWLDDAENSEDGSRIATKGIDAFSEDNVAKRGRKKKTKANKVRNLDDRRSSSLPTSPVDSPSGPVNQWQDSNKDIEYITSRTGLAFSSVASIYYKHSASLSQTIGVVLKDNLNAKPELEDDPIIAVNVHDLGTEFPSIAFEYRTTLVRLTHPSTAAAHELAKALTTRPTGTTGGIKIVPNYVRPKIDDSDHDERTAVRSSRDVSPIDGPSSAEHASAYAAARSAALSQAYAAHRRAKSDRLMGGAAAYYGQVGRDFAALSTKASAAAADQLAASQSTQKQLDLHGVDVLNGVRIAQEKAEQWWRNLGEHRVDGRRGAEERQAGYNIVVGLGRHSEGGRSKLGPAVSRALRNAGWNIEQTGAVIVVRGKARH
ncbi:hypothetical protein DOTSEDRAFT_76059 [Dothistroma septosporum NZE10]|uniref:Smr domain-containing protein n=1 Tax=Dothistroma septosporum (strain NZE10 / CBS 128990) TaxID=675120 RepID=N1PY90_DOTSN|nr:hypothetical protein DOTSEDRAFT_76059 [Dothistroma septosporum NZE10]